MIRPFLPFRVEREAHRPPLFEPSRRAFWQDPYIGSHILNAHLDPDYDDASRRPETIDASVAWIDRIAGGADGSEYRGLLDLGCGPGLYGIRFARLGWRVTRIDYSKTSIRHARNAARGEDRSHVTAPVYRHGDFRRMTYPNGQRVVTMIYGTFGTGSDDERIGLLRRIRECLIPGGYFVVDVFTKAYTKAQRIPNEWYTEMQNGFWHRRPHIVLQDSLWYPSDVLLNRYTIIPTIGRTKTYRLWYRPFRPDSIRDLLASEGFGEVELFGDLTGAPLDEGGQWIGVVCRRA